MYENQVVIESLWFVVSVHISEKRQICRDFPAVAPPLHRALGGKVVLWVNLCTCSNACPLALPQGVIMAEVFTYSSIYPILANSSLFTLPAFLFLIHILIIFCHVIEGLPIAPAASSIFSSLSSHSLPSSPDNYAISGCNILTCPTLHNRFLLFYWTCQTFPIYHFHHSCHLFYSHIYCHFHYLNLIVSRDWVRFLLIFWIYAIKS